MGFFVQSLNDFPCPVTLGKNTPSFFLHRYRQGLRFVPPDDEGFTVRGDCRRLVYQGRRRSHRFTILGDTAFEYDCILEREPDCNVVVLRMEGAERFDFFRQPDFVREAFLKGSYAVYKKETLLGEGTGKLCHIHRPEIIDARGRRCWGDLSVCGDELHITIPEGFLSGAVYPVVVDPTVGTSSVGQLYRWDNNEPGEDLIDLMFELAIPVNRFSITEAVNGSCTAYAYVNSHEEECGGKPVLYSDVNSKPYSRMSRQEGRFDFVVNKSKPAGWRQAAFVPAATVPAGSSVWFGVFADYNWLPRFDYGSQCFASWWDYESGGSIIPDIYPVSDYYRYNFRLSMYFTYSAAQNYVRTLTQGVSLTDRRVLTGVFNRSVAQTTNAKDAVGRFETFYRKCVNSVVNFSSLASLPVFIRAVAERIAAGMDLSNSRSLARVAAETAGALSALARVHCLLRKLGESVLAADVGRFQVMFLRSVPDLICAADMVKRWGAAVRVVQTIADNSGASGHTTDYRRAQTDTVQAAGVVFRGLLLFVNIVTKIFIRDFILGRFLIAREVLVLKSVVSREIVLESKIG